ncbi:tripartite tricarboxylate transporter substrate binding protein [Xanthobacter sp. KR7-225]|uniref:Bug family tripartite tricarboxylate transporter substrate binding protein n=1 Tax=Xanthobacter sp. KR7-225 TaxID=3156613 RepID=UPI0032B43E4B
MTFQKLVTGTLIAAASLCGSFALADGFPAKPVTLVVNYPAGGGSDAIGRALARSMEKALGQPVPVENVAGGGGTRGVTAVVTAPPDGYRIGVATNSPMTIAVHNVAGLPWNAPSTYEILGGIGSMYNAVCAQPDAPFNTLKEMVDYAKKNPGQLKVASIKGGLNQYTWDQFAKAAGIDVRFVPYSGDADGIASFLGKNTELVNLTWPTLRAQLDAGKAKCLAIFAPARVATHPDVPTFKEQGYDVTTTSDYVVYAPKDLPADVRKTLVAAVETAVKDPDFVKVLSAQSIVVAFQDGGAMKTRFSDVYDAFAKAKGAN